MRGAEAIAVCVVSLKLVAYALKSLRANAHTRNTPDCVAQAPVVRRAECPQTIHQVILQYVDNLVDYPQNYPQNVG